MYGLYGPEAGADSPAVNPNPKFHYCSLEGLDAVSTHQAIKGAAKRCPKRHYCLYACRLLMKAQTSTARSPVEVQPAAGRCASSSTSLLFDVILPLTFDRAP